MLPAPKRAKPPVIGHTDVYLSFRSTPEYADWLSDLARATYRSARRNVAMQCRELFKGARPPLRRAARADRPLTRRV